HSICIHVAYILQYKSPIGVNTSLVMMSSLTDITLSCKSDRRSIRAVEWNKNGLQSPEYVLFFCDGHSDKTFQNPSFVDRVYLQDKDMKNGNVSLVLKNVTKQDEGDYECRVSLDGTNIKKIKIMTSCSRSAPVSVRPGEDATLQCRGHRAAAVVLLEWSRLQPQSEGYVFFYRNNRSYENYRHPSYRGRVELRDESSMKDGEVSVVLKNVTVHDAGTYESQSRCLTHVEDGPSCSPNFRPGHRTMGRHGHEYGFHHRDKWREKVSVVDLFLTHYLYQTRCGGVSSWFHQYSCSDQ
uniref:Ig-like domain-containing protein n=1 Tax=Seriola dumerili TaxID=41447 RepID=A0A3B4T4T9_SERDU